MATTDELAEICRSWSPYSLATFYEWVFAEQGWKLPAHFWPVCLALTDHRIHNLQLIIGPGVGKSQMLSVIYPTWLIGHDPAMTILGISGGESLMQGFQQAAQRIIESSPAFLASFPHIRPDKNAGWSSERGMFVTGHPSGIPDANYLAAGMNSTYITGKHGRTLIVDDLHNKENSATAEQCKKVKETYYNTILGRADPMGARIIVAGRRWSTEDIYGSLIESESFVTLRLPFIRDGEKQLYYDVYVPDDIECVFTDGKVHCGDGSIVSV